MSCAAKSFCMVVGGGTLKDVALSYQWNGKTWTPLAVRGNTGLTELDSVLCSSSVSCIAVGNGFAHGKSADFAEVWNGKGWAATAPIAWKKGAVALGAASVFRAVTCLRKTFCVAAGQSGQVGTTTGATELTGFWNGKSWHLVAPK